MSDPDSRSLLSSLKGLISGSVDTVRPAPAERLRLSGRGLRVPIDGMSFEIEMGDERLQLHPVFRANGRVSKRPVDYALFNVEQYESGIFHFLDLLPGKNLVLSQKARDHRFLFNDPRNAFRRHLQIRHEGDALVFRDPISEIGTFILPMRQEVGGARILDRRRRALREVLDAYGGPIRNLAADEALQTLRDVNALLKNDAFRKKDSLDNPGALLKLPPDVTPILVGDLHGKVENLLKILGANAFLEEMANGDAAMILLGDAVHREEDSFLDDMDSSVLMMDLIFKLKLRYPDRFFFILGNHDSFSPDVMKGGVPQALVWESHLKKLRGEAFRNELELFYRLSPLVALSDDFVACHAGPPRVKTSRRMLVDLRQHPELVYQVTSNRVETRALPGGYTRSDVRRFRRSLGLSEAVPFVVGHYPQAGKGAIWLDVEKIPQHHIVYSAKKRKIGVFTRIGGEMVPQIYRREPLLKWLNEERPCSLL